jgi:hypothetical protein
MQEVVTTRRISIVAMVCFFPLAIVGLMREKTNPQSAIRLYQWSIMIMAIFLFFLAFYTYDRGGNFVKPMGTFY